MMANRTFNILVPILSVVFALIIGAFIMLGFGYNPIDGYVALWDGVFMDSYGVGESIRQISPLILTGLSVAFAFRAGLFNIGAEGQFFVGWLAAVWVGIGLDAPTAIHLPLAVIAAALAGALWGFIPGLLKATRGVHEVIVTIMMNYIAMYSTNAIIQRILTENRDETDRVAETASLRSDWLSSITEGSRLHYGILIALFAAFIMWFIMERTTTGYEIRSVGTNPNASKYAGMNVKKNIMLSMIVAGAFAGVAGAMQGLGTFENMMINSDFTDIGFNGIAVALLGANTAPGTILAAILFGGLQTGSLNMPVQADVPEELADIIIALIVFFVAASYIIRWVLYRFSKGGRK